MSSFLALGGGFLLAVLWMDLMFDALALRSPRGAPLSDAALSSIAAYYRRVTTDAHPMSFLIAAVMLATVLGALYQLFAGGAALVWRVVALLLCALPTGLAQRRIVPNAVRLGARSDPRDVQEWLARDIAWGHVACFAAMLGFVAIQLAGR